MRVLLVDDDVVQLKMVTAWLEPLGFTVEAVPDVITALKVVGNATDIALCIVDWHMRPFNGTAFVAAVRTEERFADLPILMLTAEDDPDNVRLAASYGVNGYILKPLKYRVLIDKMMQYDLVVLEDGTPARHPRVGVPFDMPARPTVRTTGSLKLEDIQEAADGA